MHNPQSLPVKSNKDISPWSLFFKYSILIFKCQIRRYIKNHRIAQMAVLIGPQGIELFKC